jgi:hypothetical protein
LLERFPERFSSVLDPAGVHPFLDERRVEAGDIAIALVSGLALRGCAVALEFLAFLDEPGNGRTLAFGT